MNNNGKYAATIVFRSKPYYESFEEEICNLKSSGYTVEGFAVTDERMYALLTKKLASNECAQLEGGKQP